MKYAAFILTLIASTAGAFQSPVARRWVPGSAVRMQAEGGATSASRRQVLGTGVGALFTTLSLSAPTTASAAKYGGFGAGSPEVLTPDASALDVDVLKSNEVQAALKETKYYLEVVKEMENQFNANPELDLSPAILKYFDFGKVRANLNVINGALDEDTQRGTDRLIRVVIQDITELDSVGRQKPGVPRSERKVALIRGKLAKIEAAFTDFLKFFEV